MRVFCDENVPTAFAKALDSLGCVKVLTVETELGSGANDYQIRKFAEKNDCVLLTNDKGFLKTKHGDDHGLLYFSQEPRPDAGDIADAVSKIESAYSDYEQVDEVVPGGWI